MLQNQIKKEIELNSILILFVFFERSEGYTRLCEFSWLASFSHLDIKRTLNRVSWSVSILENVACKKSRVLPDGFFCASFDRVR